MEGMKDYNELSLKDSVEHLRKKYQFNSSGDAKCIYDLILFYDKVVDLGLFSVSESTEIQPIDCTLTPELEKHISHLKDAENYTKGLHQIPSKYLK